MGELVGASQLKIFGLPPTKTITKHAKNGVTGMSPVDILPKTKHFQSMRESLGNSGPTSGMQFTKNEDDFETDTLGWQTNNVIPVAKVAKKFALPIMTAKQVRQIIITRKDKKDTAFTDTEKFEIARGYDVSADHARYTMLNLPAWNWLNYAMEKQPKTPDDVLSASECWDRWVIEGIVRSEEGELGPYDQNHIQYEQERLFNVVVKGEIDTHDVWPLEKTTMTRLWFILKKEDKEILKDKFNLNPYHLTSKGSTYKAKKKSTRPFQLVPWCDKNFTYPPNDVLKYTDEFGFEHLGIPIYIGTVKDIDARYEEGEISYNEDVRFNINTVLNQPKIVIYLNPQ